jgi:hypothetical protein
MSDEASIDYQQLYESMVSENERLRERLTKLKLTSGMWESIVYFVKQTIKSTEYWLGIMMGLVFAGLWYLSSSFERE